MSQLPENKMKLNGPKILTRETVAKILSENVTYSPQVDAVVIHGAIEKILSEHYKAIDHIDNQFNAVMDVVNILCNAAAGHELGVLNDWLDKYADDDFKINWRKILEEKKLL